MTQVLSIYRRSELEAADCLYRYKSIWLDGLDDTNDYAARGIAFHKIKHRYIEKLVAKGLSQDFEEATAAFIEGIAESQTPARLIPEVRELWERHAIHFELDLQRFVTAEEKQEGGGFVFTPDYVYAYPERNELEINDDKSFFSALTEAQAKSNFQSRFYIRHAMDRWPNFASYRFTYHFVRFGIHVSVVYSRSDMDALDREVTALVESIELAKQTGHWPATAGPSCTYCQLRCPLVDQQLTMPKRLESIQQAVNLAAWALAADQMVKSAKKMLKQYATANGPIDVGGVEWANRPVLERKYPLDQVIDVFRRAGLLGAFEATETEPALTISYSALAKVFKKFPALEQELSAVRQDKKVFRFSAKKPGMDEGDDPDA